MELQEFLKVLRREYLVVLIVPLMALIVSMTILAQTPVTYETATTLTINRVTTLDQTKVPFYLYDNFYSIQSAGFFADTVVAWFNSPTIVREIFERAAIDPGRVTRTKQLQYVFRSRKIVPANIEVSTSRADQGSGEKLLSAATEAVKARVDEISKSDAKSGGVFQVHAEKPITVLTTKPFLLLAGASVILGLILGSFIAVIKEYLK